MREYDKLIVREFPRAQKRYWEDLENIIEDVPGKALLMVAGDELYILDVCASEEFEAANGELLLSRIEMCKQIADMASKNTSKTTDLLVVHFPKTTIVTSIEEFIRLGLDMKGRGVHYSVSCNETGIDVNLKE